MSTVSQDRVRNLKEKILDDLKARDDWREKDQIICERRLGSRPKQKKNPYPGAPNFVEMIIDDVVREKTDQEISMLFNAPRLCHVAPIDNMPADVRAKIEQAFDSYLRYVLPETRSKLEEAMDTKNCRGFSVMGALRAWNDTVEEHVPDFEVWDILDTIVPADTKSPQDAERIAYALRWTDRELRTKATEKKWNLVNVNEAITTCSSDDRYGASREIDDDTHEITKRLVGLDDTQNQKYVLTLMVYHYAEESDVKYALENKIDGIELDRKIVTVFCPALPEKPFAMYPWKEKDTVKAEPMSPEEAMLENAQAALMQRSPNLMKQVTVPGKDRLWPCVRAALEKRSRYWYDSRGLGHLCMDEQIGATAERNSHSVMLEYYAQPLTRNASGSKNTSNITFAPGSFIGDYEFVVPPNIPQQFTFDINAFRMQAARRAGAQSQYSFSTEMGRRKLEKSATEVTEESQRSAQLSSSSVDRFNEPLAELFQLIWDDLRRMRLKFPVIVPGGEAGLFDEKWYDYRLKMVPAASAKTLNPDVQVAKMMQMVAFNAQYAQQTNFDIKRAVEVVNAAWDWRMTDSWIPKQGQLLPFAQQLQQTQGDIQKLAEGGKMLQDRIGGVEKVAVQAFDKANKITVRQDVAKDTAKAPA